MITTYSELLMPTLNTTEQNNLSEEEEKKNYTKQTTLSLLPVCLKKKNGKYRNRQKYIDLNEILLLTFKNLPF